jgi:enoyl-CoA hydratase/carnithine racemase
LDDSQVGMPEATLPVVPGMEGCHWAFRKTDDAHWPKLMQMLLGGNLIKSRDAVGWLVDYAGSLEDCLQITWKIASGQPHSLPRRSVETNALSGIPADFRMPGWENGAAELARKAILDTIRDSCGVSIAEALDVQARHSADFMTSKACSAGRIGQEYTKVMAV